MVSFISFLLFSPFSFFFSSLSFLSSLSFSFLFLSLSTYEAIVCWLRLILLQWKGNEGEEEVGVRLSSLSLSHSLSIFRKRERKKGINQRKKNEPSFLWVGEGRKESLFVQFLLEHPHMASWEWCKVHWMRIASFEIGMRREGWGWKNEDGRMRMKGCSNGCEIHVRVSFSSIVIILDGFFLSFFQGKEVKIHDKGMKGELWRRRRRRRKGCIIMQAGRGRKIFSENGNLSIMNYSCYHSSDDETRIEDQRIFLS